MKKGVGKVLCLIVALFFSISTVKAASFTISVGQKSLTKGASTKLTIKGTDVTGRFNIKSSNAGVISISESAVWIENNSYSINLSALSVGTSTITVSAGDVSDSSGNAVSLGSKTITITVSLPKEKDTVNTLKSLSVEGYEISPAFSKDVTDYAVTVSEGTKEINVLASATSSYASVTGTGTVSLIEGINNLSITVTAESGSKKVYNLVVNVIDENPINVVLNEENYTVVKLQELITCPSSFVSSEQVIENIPVPSCTNSAINYTLVGLKDSLGNIKLYRFNDNNYEEYSELTSKSLTIINKDSTLEVAGYEKDKIEINGITYDCYKSSVSDRFVLIYGINIETGEEGLYLYDLINETFSFYVNDLVDNLNTVNQKYLYVIIIFGVSIFLSIICIIKLASKKKKKSKDKVENNLEKERPKEDNKEKEIEEESNNKKIKKNKTKKIKDNKVVDNETKE